MGMPMATEHDDEIITVDTLAREYMRTTGCTRDHAAELLTESLAPREREAVFGGTAAEFYGLET